MARPSLVRVVEASQGTSNDPNPVGPTLTMAVDATGGNALIVHVAAGFNTANPSYQTTGVTYNGAAMTLIAQQRDTFYNSADVSAWYLANPPAGTHNVVASVSNGGNPSDSNIVAALVYSDVDTGDPYGAAFTEVTTTGGDTVAFIGVTDSGSNDIVIALMSTGTSINASDVGQTQAWINNGTNNSSGGNATGEYQDGASGTVDFGWNIGNDGWQAVAFTLHGSGGGSTVSGAGSSAGEGSASGVGAATASGVGGAAGAGAASATGSALANGVATAMGASIASAIGSGLANGVGSAAGAGSASATGSALADGVGNASGAGTANGVDGASASGVGSASGTSTASGAGEAGSIASGAGTASGSAIAAAVGAANAAGAGSVAGAASVSGAGSALAKGVGTAGGLATAVGRSDDSAALTFYLLSGGLPESIDGSSMLALPAMVQYNGGEFLLAAGFLSTTDRATMILQNPQPSGWDGTVASARRLLRENDLIHAWWVFDWFATKTGATSDADARPI